MGRNLSWYIYSNYCCYIQWSYHVHLPYAKILEIHFKTSLLIFLVFFRFILILYVSDVGDGFISKFYITWIGCHLWFLMYVLVEKGPNDIWWSRVLSNQQTKQCILGPLVWFQWMDSLGWPQLITIQKINSGVYITFIFSRNILYCNPI